MGRIFYQVCATFHDEQTLAEWLSWMHEKHLADVKAAGAETGRVVQLDEPALTAVAQYEFTDRAAFESYSTAHAPRLRAEGLARFGDRIRYLRQCGEIQDHGVCRSYVVQKKEPAEGAGSLDV